MDEFSKCSDQSINSFSSVIVESVFGNCIAYDVVPQDDVGFELEFPSSQKKSNIQNWGDSGALESEISLEVLGNIR